VTEISQPEDESALNQAVVDGGAYDVIRKRLLEQGQAFEKKLQDLNQQREQQFGQTALAIISRVRVRTENNCVPRDIVRVNQHLLFGYNVFIGLKKTTQVSDVFSLYELKENEGLDVVAVDEAASFLHEPRFVSDFQELYGYYQHARLLQLQVTQETLLATFQIGHAVSDVRVFRWRIHADGRISYIDNRGERDIVPPASHDFSWTQTTRDDQILGKHPHFSILDEVFVETIHGQLTVKIENNTEDGIGVFQEPVDDTHQSLDDADIHYAKVGVFILLKIKPYREDQWRYLVFNTRSKRVVRIDAIGLACIQLPEDHGIIFPGGYYLQNDESKRFEDKVTGLHFRKQIKSPNGEDVWYVFYEDTEGKFALFAYNLIRKELQHPMYGHGYCVYEDGKAIIFQAEHDDPTRHHPMQIWQTPFYSENYAHAMPTNDSFLAKIGNAELVRGISDLYSITRAMQSETMYRHVCEDIISACQRALDSYYWLAMDDLGDFATPLKTIAEITELVLDEFEKVQSIQAQARQALTHAQLEQQRLLHEINTPRSQSPEQFAAALLQLRQQRGHLKTIAEYRYMDMDALAELETQVLQAQEGLGQQTVQFLAKDDAFTRYADKIQLIERAIEASQTVVVIQPKLAELDELAVGLEMLNDMLASIKVEDATVRTRILSEISEVYGKLNQAKAHANMHRKSLTSQEAVAEFAAQFTLFTQSMTSALSLVESPEQCDEQLSRLVIQLDEMESKFSEHDEFLSDILQKREALYEVFESKKQALLDERQRKAQHLMEAADRVLTGIQRRSQKFTSLDELNTYFSSDAMVIKINALIDQLHGLEDTVGADDLAARLKSQREQAIRTLRDKTEIFDDDGKVIKLGRHRFSVNTQALDLTLIKRADQLVIHLTGTGFNEPLVDDRLTSLMTYWDQPLVSETKDVYRAEYLAAKILLTSEKANESVSWASLKSLWDEPEKLNRLISHFASQRYQEGYQKGIHDVDCGKILSKLIPLHEAAGLLKYAPLPRAVAALFWSLYQEPSPRQSWISRAQSAKVLLDSLASKQAFEQIQQEINEAMQACLSQYLFPFDNTVYTTASEYLVHVLADADVSFMVSRYAKILADGLLAHMEKITHREDFDGVLDSITDQAFAKWTLTESWLNGYLQFNQLEKYRRYVPEAISLLIIKNINRQHSALDLMVEVDGLMGDHVSIQARRLTMVIDEFFERLAYHQRVVVQGFNQFQQLKQCIVNEQKKILQLSTFQASPLSSFVRNKLINDVYLPMIGDNLAKQMGTVGDTKRTDLMGLLLLISPPGYGKTTLMEYIADRLGLVFMKINCPSLGHQVHSLDPANAPNATAKQELEKLSLGLEMANNVMLYLDDIQHTHPEFLQKFISLCDGTRRIEAVRHGQSKTYDLRGKKFCIVMAGNPYTESGELFKIPDMLANRADVYNLGDILTGQDDVFALSFLENTLTSNAVLAPLATRDMQDVYRFIALAKGDDVSSSEFSHDYSRAETGEIVSLLKKLFVVQRVLLKVNQLYISSAATDDRYRTEPPFKLQGSYRNMNKIAEKVVAVMDDKELQHLISDHYQGEAQLLTTGAEENLLKLAELRQQFSDEQHIRWQKIKKDYQRMQSMGGDEVDAATKVAKQIALLSEQLNQLPDKLNKASSLTASLASISQQMMAIQQRLAQMNMDVKVVNQPVPGLEKAFSLLAETIDTSFIPVVKSMNHKIDLDLNILNKVSELTVQLRQFTNAH